VSSWFSFVRLMVSVSYMWAVRRDKDALTKPAWVIQAAWNRTDSHQSGGRCVGWRLKLSYTIELVELLN